MCLLQQSSLNTYCIPSPALCYLSSVGTSVICARLPTCFARDVQLEQVMFRTFYYVAEHQKVWYADQSTKFLVPVPFNSFALIAENKGAKPGERRGGRERFSALF